MTGRMKEKDLTILARKLLKVCDKKEDYLEILELIHKGLLFQWVKLVVQFAEQNEKITEAIKEGYNIEEWSKAWDMFKDKKNEK